jgi:hypothetical protein
VEDWVGTVELAGTVMVPPLSVRIARGRGIRCSGSAVKVPRNQVVLVDRVSARCIYGAVSSYTGSTSIYIYIYVYFIP